MTRFSAMPVALQVLLMSLQLITLCIGVCGLPVVYKNRRVFLKIIYSVLVLLAGALSVLFSSCIRAEKQVSAFPAITQWLLEQPAAIITLGIIGSLTFFIVVSIKYYKINQHRITAFSVKESLDNIPTGLCFYIDPGRVILSNRCMNGLCHEIVGRDLQNASLFWQILTQGQTGPGVKRLSYGEQPSFALPDGKIWTFSCQPIDDVIQLTAVDTTELYHLTKSLEAENESLKSFNTRLRQFGENADALTRAKERVEIKGRVHRILGQALLATRHYLHDGDSSADTAVEMWKSSIGLLRKEAEGENEDPLKMLIKAADAIGIRIVVSGVFPQNNSVSELFALAAAESLTNAITHAKAEIMYLDLTESEDQYELSVYNDGLLPQGDITEGGGLGDLRRKVERLNGTMRVLSQPQYMLVITIRKEVRNEAQGTVGGG